MMFKRKKICDELEPSSADLSKTLGFASEALAELEAAISAARDGQLHVAASPSELPEGLKPP